MKFGIGQADQIFFNLFMRRLDFTKTNSDYVVGRFGPAQFRFKNEDMEEILRICNDIPRGDRLAVERAKEIFNKSLAQSK